MKSLFYALALAALITVSGTDLANANDSPGNHDTVKFLSDQHVSKFWYKRNPGKEFEYTEIWAKFRKPEGDGPFPAVVLVHGCGGQQPKIEMWADFWTARGYASIAPDSIRPRGHSNICHDLSGDLVNQTQRVEDVYGAIKYLATLPIIDTSKIILMGYSNGAGTVMDAVSNAKEQKFNRSPAKIVASIPVYPDCGFHTPPYLVPMLILIGDADDWTPSHLCERHLKMRNTSPTVLKIYPGAHHGYDGNTETYVSNAYNKHSSSGRGATIKPNPAALAASKKDIDAFLAEYVK